MPLPRSEARARLRSRRDVQLVAAVERRHLDLAAERQDRVTDRQLAEQVVAVAVEELVLLDVDDDVEIARRAAGAAVLAFVLEAQLLAGGDARRES